MEIIQQYFTDFSQTQITQFAALKDLYSEWNEKINVISRKDMDNFYEHHVLHSLTIATQFEFTKLWSNAKAIQQGVKPICSCRKAYVM